MEILTKAADAALMFWQSLDDRERMMLLAFGSAIVWSVAMSAQMSQERRREERIIERLRQEVTDAR